MITHNSHQTQLLSSDRLSTEYNYTYVLHVCPFNIQFLCMEYTEYLYSQAIVIKPDQPDVLMSF